MGTRWGARFFVFDQLKIGFALRRDTAKTSRTTSRPIAMPTTTSTILPSA